ncbi:MAG: hypothetical protein GX366_04990 [Epulopiscium sp.]|nr:hypothetical protein [Candidatus Epulonipiscium sp.]
MHNNNIFLPSISTSLFFSLMHLLYNVAIISVQNKFEKGGEKVNIHKEYISVRNMNKKAIFNRQNINKKCLILSWTGALLSSIPRYFDTGSFYEMAMVWLISFISFVIPTIVYFIKKDSEVFAYSLVVALYTAILLTIFQQGGAIGGVFLLFICVALTAMFFDKKITIFSMIFGTILLVALYQLWPEYFFPTLGLADITELYISMNVIGLLIIFQANVGGRLVSGAESREQTVEEGMDIIKELSIASERITTSTSVQEDKINDIQEISEEIMNQFGLLTMYLDEGRLK